MLYYQHTKFGMTITLHFSVNPIDPNPAVPANVVCHQSGHIRPEKNGKTKKINIFPN